MIGYLFAHLPFSPRVITRLNCMTALFAALGSGAMVFLAHELTAHWVSFGWARASEKPGTPPPAGLPAGIAAAASVLAGLATAFSRTWWAQSTSVEVYALHCLFLPVILTFFLRMVRLEATSFGRNSVLFACALGLSFTNHMTTVLLAPACLYLYFATGGFGARNLRKILLLAIPFGAGLLPYLYLPVRSLQNPLLDWGHPADLLNFLKHVGGAQYRVWMFTPGAAEKNWTFFLHEFPAEFSLPGLALIVVGLVALARNKAAGRARLAVFLLLLFSGCLLYTINYDITEIAPYFITAYAVCPLVMALGAALMLERVARRKAAAATWFGVALALGVGAGGIAASFREVDESRNTMVEDFTRNVLTNLPPNAIIFSAGWEFWTSGAFYFQLVEGVRPDVLVVDVPLLHDRPWYSSHLKRRAPEVMARVQPELDAFSSRLARLDRNEGGDQDETARAYEIFTDALVRRNPDRPIFVGIEMVRQPEPSFATRFKPFPAGVAHRLAERATFFESRLPVITWRDPDPRRRTYNTDYARLLQAAPLALYGQELARRGRPGEARTWFDLALTFKPDLQVRLETLRPRDVEYARSTNEMFAGIEQFRLALQ